MDQAFDASCCSSAAIAWASIFLCARAGERKRYRLLFTLAVALFRSQRLSQRFDALGFGLLKLDVLALESPRHDELAPGPKVT
jgi:hypothetical protein